MEKYRDIADRSAPNEVASSTVVSRELTNTGFLLSKGKSDDTTLVSIT
jgi:hypothetical protein